MPELQRVEVECQEPGCDATRLVHHASVHEVKRCLDCQNEYKRRKARERYRKRKGLPLEDPKKQNKPIAKKIEKSKVDGWFLTPRDPEESKPKKESVFKEKPELLEELMRKTWEKCFPDRPWDDVATTDDW